MSSKFQELGERRARLEKELHEELAPKYEETRDKGILERMNNVKAGIARANQDMDDELQAGLAERRYHIDGEPNAHLRTDTHKSQHRAPSPFGRGADEACSAALRAIDNNADCLSPQAGDRISLVAERDATGATAAYLAAVADPDYRSAFLKRLANPDQPNDLLFSKEQAAMQKVAQAEQVRAMSLAEGKLGGFAVPFELDPSIMLTTSGSTSPLREVARSVTVVSSNVWKGISSEGVEASFDAEAEEVSDDSPELSQPEIPVEKAQCFVPWSIELGADYSALGQELAQLMADAKAQLEATKFLLGEGSGSNEPEGLISKLAEASIVETAGEGEVAAGDVYSLQEELGPRFQDNASWLSSLAVANQVYRFYSPAGEEPPLFNQDRTQLLGKPWREASPMSSKTTTGEELVLAYGDFNAGNGYVIADRVGMSIELIPHLFGTEKRPTGQRGTYAYWRVGGAPVVDNAVRLLEVK